MDFNEDRYSGRSIKSNLDRDVDRSLSSVIWENVDRYLDEQNKDLAWLADNCGFNNHLALYNLRSKRTMMSMTLVARIAKVLGVNISNLCAIPVIEAKSARYLVDEVIEGTDSNNSIALLSTYIPKLSKTRQKLVLETILSFFDTTLDELEGDR